jgi:ABC transport system ATP-binding/permease protein
VLVLDEPTNDLDIETLELLESQLVAWPGTLLLVSHDRVFLDNVVTSTLVFEGDGRVEEYVGGYEDWLHQRPRPAETEAAAPAPVERRPRSAPARPGAKRKLSYNEQRELEQLPARIESLEDEKRQLTDAVATPEFYKEAPDAIRSTLQRLETVDEELTAAYARWDELDSRA